jgi:hypothetical protein
VNASSERYLDGDTTDTTDVAKVLSALISDLKARGIVP